MYFDQLRRREFITLLGGTAAWPLAVRAQQAAQRMRRIAVLWNFSPSDAEGQLRLTAFGQGLQQLGWTVGRNVRIDYRWNAENAEQIRKNVADVIALAPDVILVAGGRNLAGLQQTDRSIPVVFVSISDPVSGGFVESLGWPGGNATGFGTEEYGISGKRLELLKQIVPGLTRAAALRDPANPGGSGQLGAILAVAPALGVEVTPIGVREVGEIERGITAFARSANGGLVITSGILTAIHRELIVALAARHRLPAVYPGRYHVDSGGLISYGTDFSDHFRQAAGYIDRIFKGEKPAEIPVQQPTKFELVINLKTAKALGLEVPATVLARADEVIE
jgi:putative tryptophan/tyrosine transport system substrate-binding protein